jgi:hypothetical protein
MTVYNPADWYWIVAGDGAQVWSSRLAQYILVDHADYVAFLGNGSLPSRIASEAELAEVLNEHYPAGSPIPAEPIRSVQRIGIVRFTVAAGVVSTTSDTVGIAAVTRVSTGRFRIFYEVEDTELTFMPDVGCIRDASVIGGRVTNRTTSFVEVRTVNASGVAADAAEIIVTFDRVVTT